jgi:DNA (cytosine-5)-methyltransferase 1
MKNLITDGKINENHQTRTITQSNVNLQMNSFFAGIGGFDLGFQLAGIQPTFHCEVNYYCNSVLRRHWPEVCSIQDLLEVKPEEIPNAEIWSGGFPCQDVSVARGWLGRDGLKGRNTGLFYPFVELVKTRLPKVVLMENVTGLLNSHRGQDFAIVLDMFNKMGYGVAWRIMNTRYFGAPQSRPRVYICAWLDSPLSAMNVLYESGKTTHPENPRLGFLRPTFCPSTGAYVPEIAYCLAATSGRHTGTDWSRSYVSYENQVRRLTPTECERLQGFPEGWTLPSEDFHLTDDEIDTLRYHALGNAVSVPVVKWIANRILAEIKDSSFNAKNVSNFWETNQYIAQNVPDLSLKKAITVDLDLLRQVEDLQTIKWSSGGVMANGKCIMAQVSSSPVEPVESRFVDILDKTKPDTKYFLSSNAAVGILRRVKSQERELFQPLHAALEKLAQLKF